MSKQSTELFAFFVSLANAVALSLKDGVIGVGDLANFFQTLRTAPAAFEGLQQIPAELADLSEEQRAALYAEVDKLDLPNDQREAIAKKVLKGVVVLSEIVFALVAPKAEAAPVRPIG